MFVYRVASAPLLVYKKHTETTPFDEDAPRLALRPPGKAHESKRRPPDIGLVGLSGASERRENALSVCTMSAWSKTLVDGRPKL